VKSRDSSLDFIKGIAILSVILLHSTPHHKLLQIAWIGQAVPLFLLVTAYLTYGSFHRGQKLSKWYSGQSVLKMFKRILLPFVLVTLIQCIIFCIFKSNFSFLSVVTAGGIGPGCYYPWIYLQCWIALPLMIWVIDRLSIARSFILFLAVSVALEIISSFLSVPAFLYRLLFYRYLFLIYLGCIIHKIDFKLNRKWIILAIVAIAFAVFEIYGDTDMRPMFYNQWKGYHWLTAFYAVFIFCGLRSIYNTIQYNTISNLFILLGKNSWEIFLCQMFVFSMAPRVSVFSNLILDTLLFISVTSILSIVPVVLYKYLTIRRKNRIINNR
jgi:peptidoglycan/LPS O-acetylase OafA/YrhL